MKTDDLIKAISTDAGRPAPSMAGAWGLALVAAALVALVVFTAMLGPRPDIAEAVATLRFPFKFVVTLALAGSALAVLQAVARPGADWRRMAPWLALAPALLLCAVALELLAVPAGEWRARLVGVNSMVCLAAIPLIGPAAGRRGGGPARRRRGGDLLCRALHRRFAALRRHLVHRRRRHPCRARRASRAKGGALVGHDPEKWKPGFGQDHAQENYRRRSRLNWNARDEPHGVVCAERRSPASAKAGPIVAASAAAS